LPLGVVAPSLSDSRPNPNPTSFRLNFSGIWGTASFDCLAEARIGRTVERSSSSDEYGFSLAVLKESVREEGYRSFGGGRRATGGMARGGVKSGVGGLC
jgi:hypothetical protein